MDKHAKMRWIACKRKALEVSLYLTKMQKKREINIKKGRQKKGCFNYNRMRRLHALLQVTIVATARTTQEVRRENGRRVMIQHEGTISTASTNNIRASLATYGQ